MKLFVSTGMGTPGGAAGDDLTNPGAYGLEMFIRLMNDTFALALRQAEVPFEQNFYLGGYHGWPYWQQELHVVLPVMIEELGAPRPGVEEGAASAEQADADGEPVPSDAAGALSDVAQIPSDVAEVPPLPRTGAEAWPLGLVLAGLAVLALRLPSSSTRRAPAGGETSRVVEGVGHTAWDVHSRTRRRSPGFTCGRS